MDRAAATAAATSSRIMSRTAASERSDAPADAGGGGGVSLSSDMIMRTKWKSRMPAVIPAGDQLKICCSVACQCGTLNHVAAAHALRLPATPLAMCIKPAPELAVRTAWALIGPH